MKQTASVVGLALLCVVPTIGRAQCLGDFNGDGKVTIDELITAVNSALNGCQVSARFVDNGDGTIRDNQTGFIWEKKDQGGGLHDVNGVYLWAGECNNDINVPCQPDGGAAATCTDVTGGADGCAQCSDTTTCVTSGYVTIWQWLNQLNAANFAGHNDWRIPTVGRDGAVPQLETILAIDAVPTCGMGYYGTGPACVPPAFNTGCTGECTVMRCSCTLANTYWSATTDARSPAGAWLVDFFTGAVGGEAKDGDFRVRAVRRAP